MKSYYISYDMKLYCFILYHFILYYVIHLCKAEVDVAMAMGAQIWANGSSNFEQRLGVVPAGQMPMGFYPMLSGQITIFL